MANKIPWLFMFNEVLTRNMRKYMLKYCYLHDLFEETTSKFKLRSRIQSLLFIEKHDYSLTRSVKYCCLVIKNSHSNSF